MTATQMSDQWEQVQISLQERDAKLTAVYDRRDQVGNEEVRIYEVDGLLIGLVVYVGSGRVTVLEGMTLTRMPDWLVEATEHFCFVL